MLDLAHYCGFWVAVGVGGHAGASEGVHFDGYFYFKVGRDRGSGSRWDVEASDWRDGRRKKLMLELREDVRVLKDNRRRGDDWLDGGGVARGCGGERAERWFGDTDAQT